MSKYKLFASLMICSLLFGCSNTSTDTHKNSESSGKTTTVQNDESSKEAEKADNYQLPVIVDSGVEIKTREETNTPYKRGFVKIENPNPDLIIDLVAVDCIIRDSESRIVDQTVFVFSHLAPLSTTIEFSELPISNEEYETGTDPYSYEFSIDNLRQIMGIPLSAVDEQAIKSIQVSNIKHNDDTLFPEVSFEFKNIGESDLSCPWFSIEFLNNGTVVNKEHYAFPELAKVGETYVIQVPVSTLFPAPFDEVKVIYDYNDYYEYDKYITLQEAIPIG